MRQLNANRTWTCASSGSLLTLPGRAVLLARNVGIHMYTDAVTMPMAGKQGEEELVPEGIVDAMVTAAAALHDRNGNSRLVNSKAGSVYVVKPKMHGPEEGAFVVELFGRVEEVLGLPKNTIKIGVSAVNTHLPLSHGIPVPVPPPAACALSFLPSACHCDTPYP
jgi:malate synthase